ncbi:MAG: hypothetical protein FJ102_20955 [Deltaproteobacteria bacterium]|nr:hypothetical protein [Deltaproteobacteria bacterium]
MKGRAAWRAALDRELLLAAAVHDLRGPATVIGMYAELNALPGTHPVALAAHRLIETSAHIEDYRAPGEMLAAALADTTSRVGNLGGARILEVGPFPAGTLPVSFDLARVRRWLAAPEPGLVAARVLVAARASGIDVEQDVARGLLLLRTETTAPD